MSETLNKTPEPAPTPAPAEPEHDRFRELFGTVQTTVLAVILALLVGAILIALSNAEVIESMGYFFSYPWDFFSRSWDAIWVSYSSLVTGALGSADGLASTLNRSAPLICGGLGVALAFRAGLFNIGAQGQIVIGTLVGSYIGFSWDLPGPTLLVASVLGGVLGGAVWGGIAGLLKAVSGAHEVISTIMLNQIATAGVLVYLLNHPAFRSPGSNEPKSPVVADNAVFPSVFGVHLGVLLAIVAAVGFWWVMERSRLGFELKAAGANPDAALTAGMSTTKIFALAMTLAGALSGLAAVMLINGDAANNSDTLVGSVGFDAITVALLGRASPLGTVLAGLLFGAMTVGGTSMLTSSAATPLELVQVVQALIVLFIAAPALVRWIRLKRRKPETTPTPEGATA